jgi:protein-tyrosine phosphatase
MAAMSSEPAADAIAERRRWLAPREQADPAVPLRIDWIEARRLGDGAPGRLGLTFLPGKHGASDRYPGVTYGRNLDADLAALRLSGVRHLLLLVEDDELARWGDPAIVGRAESHGVTVRRRPIPEGGVPGSPAEMKLLLSELRTERMRGDVAVACMGGVGRTGIVAACALVAGGMEPDAAIALVRDVRHPDAVETETQVAFVRRFAREMARPGP